MKLAIVLRLILKTVRMTHEALNQAEKSGLPIVHEFIAEVILDGVRYGERRAARDLIDDQSFKEGLLLILTGIRKIRLASVKSAD